MPTSSCLPLIVSTFSGEMLEPEALHWDLGSELESHGRARGSEEQDLTAGPTGDFSKLISRFPKFF